MRYPVVQVLYRLPESKGKRNWSAPAYSIPTVLKLRWRRQYCHALHSFGLQNVITAMLQEALWTAHDRDAAAALQQLHIPLNCHSCTLYTSTQRQLAGVIGKQVTAQPYWYCMRPSEHNHASQPCSVTGDNDLVATLKQLDILLNLRQLRFVHLLA